MRNTFSSTAFDADSSYTIEKHSLRAVTGVLAMMVVFAVASGAGVSAQSPGEAAKVLRGNAAFGDWREDAPGIRRLIRIADLPEIGPEVTNQSLNPRIVVAGHKNPKNDDNGSRVIGHTRQYILDFQELAGKTTTAKELYDQMLARYPEWLNRGALWSSATAVKK
jgi:hypothetical protein